MLTRMMVLYLFKVLNSSVLMGLRNNTLNFVHFEAFSKQKIRFGDTNKQWLLP